MRIIDHEHVNEDEDDVSATADYKKCHLVNHYDNNVPTYHDDN